MPAKPALPALALLLAVGAAPALADSVKDAAAIAALDTAYQDAVERNDADAMAAILHPDMVVILGDGRVENRETLLELARNRTFEYERQVEEPGTQTVRMYGPDTGVVTALLWLKGTRNGQAFDRRLWFSDTYVRTSSGWRYAFGQASTALPPAPRP